MIIHEGGGNSRCPAYCLVPRSQESHRCSNKERSSDPIVPGREPNGSAKRKSLRCGDSSLNRVVILNSAIPLCSEPLYTVRSSFCLAIPTIPISIGYDCSS